MQAVATPREDRWWSPRWSGLGLGVVGVLAAVNVGGTLVDDGAPAATNIAGALALAPALTGAGAGWRPTLLVATIALLTTAVLVRVDEVATLFAWVRIVVVASAGVLATLVARHRTRQRALLEDRREAAEILQSALLTELAEPEDLDLAARYVPAGVGDRVGGDWYDAIVDRDGNTTVIIGDVVGHDLRAAAAMGQLRGLLRAYAVEGGQLPSHLLSRAEWALQRLNLDIMATAVVARVHEVDGARQLWVSRAGHPPPALLRPDGSAVVLETPGDLPLGLGLGPDLLDRHDELVDFPDGSMLLLYTDGLVERRDGSLHEQTQELLQALRRDGSQPVDAALDRIIADLGPTGDDDVAVLAVQTRPRPVSR
ncbi:PP2C family protein-serine/threonine phosphatase [Kineococcus gynurae]|uniref:PP2C family protein-serine/threonine phosphatase n=1 Tax=Kineococcus gynurae TaxID=452979 RepID=A0ABV5LNU1_9ACTN